MWNNIVEFFIKLGFDSTLDLINCIVGVIALFLGGTAYKNCKTFKKSFNDEKEFSDNAVDNSIKAGGDINYNACDTNALVTLTSENFKTSMQQTYTLFEQKTDDNLRRIINEASRIVQENKLQLSSYTKIDWINIYFENAKNAADNYMQGVWAKVLAKELSCPDSFSFKTLDILKNMSADDFRKFEEICSYGIDGYILESDKELSHQVSWVDRLKLKELGLLNLESTEKTYTIIPDKTTIISYQDKYLIAIKNIGETNVDHKVSIHMFSNSATELFNVANLKENYDYIVDVAKGMKKIAKEGEIISLHKINYMTGTNVNYQLNDLLDIPSMEEQYTNKRL